MDKKDKTKVALVIQGIPRSLRSYFRARCALHQITMKEKIIQMIRSYVRGDK